MGKRWPDAFFRRQWFAMDLRFAILGAGFWARYQLAAWREVTGAECVAIYNRTRGKAEELAREVGVPAVYDDAEALIDRERPDFLDVITSPDTHARFVELAASRRVPVVCQKPMAPTLAEAERMVQICAETGTPFIVHENWRWQTPLRELKALLDSGQIGRPFRARIQYSNSFPVFDNQPFLKTLDEFILTDIGSHILDVARFLFGDAERLYCQTHRVHPDIRGEDVATVMLEHGDLTCTCEMSYASKLEHERFPQTYVLIEGDRGSLELCPDYWIRCTTESGTLARRHVPPSYPWANPAYDLIHASIVACNADILRSLRGGPPAETRAEDNIKTIRLVFGSYQSARTKQAIQLI
jgi:D-apiose dehydrogenase